jgi:MFS family permease
MHRVALLWLVLELTGSSVLMGLVATAQALPPILFGVLAGICADRMNKKRLIIITYIIQAVVDLIIPIAYFLGTLNAGWILTATFLIGIGYSFNFPAVMSIIPDLVDEKELTAANSMISVTEDLMYIIGASLGGVLIGSIGITSIFIFDALSFVLAGCLLLPVSFQPIDTSNLVSHEHTRSDSIWKSISQTAKYMLRSSLLRMLILIGVLLNVAGGITSIVHPIYVKDILRSGANGYGLVVSIRALGTFASAIILGQIRPPRKLQGWLISAALLFMGLGFILLPLNSQLTIAALLFLVIGASEGIGLISYRSIIQTGIPGNLRGQVFAITRSLMMSARPLALSASGFLIMALSSQTIYIVSGLIIVCLSFFAISSRSIRLCEADNLNVNI